VGLVSSSFWLGVDLGGFFLCGWVFILVFWGFLSLVITGCSWAGRVWFVLGVCFFAVWFGCFCVLGLGFIVCWLGCFVWVGGFLFGSGFFGCGCFCLLWGCFFFFFG